MGGLQTLVKEAEKKATQRERRRMAAQRRPLLPMRKSAHAYRGESVGRIAGKLAHAVRACGVRPEKVDVKITETARGMEYSITIQGKQSTD